MQRASKPQQHEAPATLQTATETWLDLFSAWLTVLTGHKLWKNHLGSGRRAQVILPEQAVNDRS